MSIEEAIVARAKSHVVGMRAMEILRFEASKGCSTELSNNSVSLEPPFVHFSELRKGFLPSEISVQMAPPKPSELVRVECFIPADYKLEWFRADRFLKELYGVSGRIGFEIIGNKHGIKIGFLLHKSDLDLVKVAFDGEYPQCQLMPVEPTYLPRNIYFHDFFPLSPYHHIQSAPQELLVSPYEPFVRAIAQISPPSQGFVQVLFEPARHNWRQNIESLLDIEFLAKSMADPNSPYLAQQLPSSELRHMAHAVETKAHFDKPFFFVALRSGVHTRESSFNTEALTAFGSLIHRDGQPLRYITEREYLQHFDLKKIREIFYHGLSYRPGFLLNSSELAALAHIPTIHEFVEAGLPIQVRETLELPLHYEHLMQGIEIGSGWYKGRRKLVCIPENLRRTGVHIVGKPDKGKTTTIEHMVLQDVEKGRGVAFLDPHGDSVKKLLDLIPKEHADRTIYLDFGDFDWVPLWNPLQNVAIEDRGRTADELVGSIKSIVKANAWGDRLERILTCGFLGLLPLPDATFFDLVTLFQDSGKKKDDKRRLLKDRILEAADDEVVRVFWERDFDNYRRDDFAPVQHKISKLMTHNRTVSLMLSQPESRIDFREIMESEKILLLDLSGLGPHTRGVMGCFLLAFLYNTAISRSRIDPDDRKTFSIYCDEAHKLTTDTLEDMLAECRKFGIKLTLAHQFLSQFQKSKVDALTTVGTTIIFNVDIADANYLVKDLQGKVEPGDLAKLKKGEAIVRIDTDIIKISTPKPKKIPESSYRQEIIRKSREQYCAKAEEIREHIQGKHKRVRTGHLQQATIMNDLGKEPLIYDEFE